MKRFFSFLLFVGVAFSCTKDDCPKPDACNLAPDPGPCEALITKYYYNQKAGKCESFDWGGCGGTVPFDTWQECKECECNQ